jgi:hypothetical protein
MEIWNLLSNGKKQKYQLHFWDSYPIMVGYLKSNSCTVTRKLYNGGGY